MKSKLDERYLQHRSQSQRRGLPFFMTYTMSCVHSSQEGQGVVANFSSAALESFFQEIQVQDAHDSYHRDSEQIRGLVCHDRSKGRILPCFLHSFISFHTSIIPSHRKFLKCIDAALAPLRLQGIRVLNYICDWLILAQSQEMAVQHRDVVVGNIRSLGLRLNTKNKACCR